MESGLGQSHTSRGGTCSFFEESSKMGYGKTKKEVFSIVQRTLMKKRSLEHFNGKG